MLRLGAPRDFNRGWARRSQSVCGKDRGRAERHTQTAPGENVVPQQWTGVRFPPSPLLPAGGAGTRVPLSRCWGRIGPVTSLIVLSGPPGIGKSTLGDAIAAVQSAVRLSIDDVEEAMLACGISAEQTGVAAYEVVRAAAEQNLALGLDVVVDAVNDSKPARDTWRRAADATGSRLLQVVLAVEDPATHRARLEGRVRPFVRITEPDWSQVQAGLATTV